MVPKDIQEEAEKFAKVSCVVVSTPSGSLVLLCNVVHTSLIGAHHMGIIDNLIPRLDGRSGNETSCLFILMLFSLL